MAGDIVTRMVHLSTTFRKFDINNTYSIREYINRLKSLPFVYINLTKNSQDSSESQLFASKTDFERYIAAQTFSNMVTIVINNFRNNKCDESSSIMIIPKYSEKYPA